MAKPDSVAFRARDYLSPQHWPFWLFLGFLRLISLLPYRIEMAVGRLLGRLLGVAMPSRARTVDINLARCFPDKTVAERKRIKSTCFENVGIGLIEMAMCWWWPEDKLKQLVEVRGLENLEAVINDGRGAILLTGHFTSLEIGGRLFICCMPMQAMYRTQGNEIWNSYIYYQRARFCADVVSRNNTRQLIRGIRKQIPTWYAPDQDFRRERNVFAPFMGIATATITAGSRLAQSANAAMLPFYPERKADGSGYILHIDPPLEQFPSGDDLQDATRINQAIEKYVLLFPENYIWLHRRFKTRPPGEPPFYP
ncbi:MAG: LpxL/LpxP family Kdo(2)-lipid IV(A) lauroyl/palmitoleoyl acyltransferase [Gammaproteobacteria bacterium]|nr:LpxL/LpxP family Kdo(2)-lipid IV(A) lauroyl/palmitoleoyl acyltransferase [Gammaproteobacteria bacterium]